jgi:hypothetical protein
METYNEKFVIKERKYILYYSIVEVEESADMNPEMDETHIRQDSNVVDRGSQTYKLNKVKVDMDGSEESTDDKNKLFKQQMFKKLREKTAGSRNLYEQYDISKKEKFEAYVEHEDEDYILVFTANGN